MPLPELPELEELYRCYRTDLYRYLCHLTHDPAEAEDTLAEHTDTRLHGRIWSAAQTAASCGRGRMRRRYSTHLLLLAFVGIASRRLPDRTSPGAAICFRLRRAGKYRGHQPLLYGAGRCDSS